MTIENIIKNMTLDEKCSLLSGESFWFTQSVERLGIKKMMLTDGSSGLRKQGDKVDHLGKNPSVPATCFPSEAAMASTWNEELVKELAKDLGDEFKHHGVGVVLGPGMNIKRSPLCGRNFEYFSEDPYLSSHIAASYINGVQSAGVGACVKHFAANNQETHRLTTDVSADERTLREIYLESFRYALENAHPWMVMCAYNRLNGEFASENTSLFDVLRREWGYDGAVVTDWGGVNDRVKSLRVGLDLEMPDSGGVFDKKVKEAIENGSLDEKHLDNAVRRLLELLEKHKEGFKTKENFTPEKNHDIAVRLGCEGVVLLKNDNNTLPLDINKKIAVIGEFAEKPRYQGGGSSHTNPLKVTVPLDELKKRFKNITYKKGFSVDQNLSDVALEQEALEAAKTCESVVVFAGLSEKYETEGIDRKTLDLPLAQNELIEKLAGVNKNIIVVLSNGAPVLMPWHKKVNSIVEGYLLGQAVGEVLAKILSGEANPSGKLAESFPQTLSDTPSFLDFPGSQGTVTYRENIFVGYRYYDTVGRKTLFPFGHGLSYTDFEYSDLTLDKTSLTDKDLLNVSLSVKNIGSRDGSEIVELYVSDKSTEIQRPLKELKGFKKVSLAVGETKNVNFTLDKTAFHCFDPKAGEWVINDGEFEILIGKSSQQIELRANITVHPIEFPQKTFDRNTSFGEIYKYKPTSDYAKTLIDYFERESGIDFNLGDNIEDFALTVISDFPLKALVTFTKGRFSEDELQKTIDKLNSFNAHKE